MGRNAIEFARTAAPAAIVQVVFCVKPPSWEGRSYDERSSLASGGPGAVYAADRGNHRVVKLQKR